MKTDILAPFTNATCNTLKLLLDVDALAEAAGKLKNVRMSNAALTLRSGSRETFPVKFYTVFQRKPL